MKAIKFRYILKAKTKVLEDRISPELALVEISGAFGYKTDNTKKIYNKFQYSLEASIIPKHFGTIKEKRGIQNYVYNKEVVEANSKYNKPFRNAVKDFETNIENVRINFKDKQPTAKEVKDYLMLISKRSERKTIEFHTIINFLQNQIKHLESIIGQGRKDEVKNTTINSFRNLIPILNRYTEATKTELLFENLDEKTYRDIWNVVNNIRTGKVKIESYTQKPKAPLAQNTIKAYQTYFIKLCKLAQKNSIDIKLDLTDTNLINEATQEHNDKTQAFLKETDIEKVINYIPTNTSLKLARNYIIIASQTGMRLQSMLEANNRKIELIKENDYDFYYIHTFQEKTKTQCFTPLFKIAFQIIKDNNNHFPNFNELKLSNLNNNIRKVLLTVGIENSKLISTHNLRSSFVSNLSILGLTESVISYVTHPAKKDKNTSAYIYDRRDYTDKAKMFVDEINRVNKLKKSNIYCF